MKNRIATLSLLSALLLAAGLICPMIGTKFISWGVLFGNGDDPVSREILLRVRIPRLLLALIAGASLAALAQCFRLYSGTPWQRILPLAQLRQAVLERSAP